MTLTELRDELRHFAAERDWERFHTPNNLAMALTAEAAELVEHFPWRSQAKPDALDEIGQEMADVLIYWCGWPTGSTWILLPQRSTRWTSMRNGFPSPGPISSSACAADTRRGPWSALSRPSPPLPAAP
jgi:hypothetical protein